MTKEERDLIITAERDPNEDKANNAMKQLREKFDPTYGFCYDCDGMVVKESECCMNQKHDEESINSEESF